MSTAILTMVYQDEYFLKLWVDYYARYTERKNLFVISHGPQDYVQDIARGCTIIEVNRREHYPGMDSDRWNFVTKFASGLTHMYDNVIYNDVDEVVVLDPEAGDDVIDYIERIPPEREVITPFPVELVHRRDHEHDFDYSRPMLAQRRFVRVNARYAKPCITRKEIFWNPDGHASDYPKLFLDDNLYLFHLKWFDTNFHCERHNLRAQMTCIDAAGNVVNIGAGTWSRGMDSYRFMADQVLDQPIDASAVGFDFDRARHKLRESFTGEGTRYSSSMFVLHELRTVPDRFVGLF